MRWVHPLDVPDVSDLLRGGEMILTTGVSIERTQPAQRRFVRPRSRGAVEHRGRTRVRPEPGVAKALVDEADRRHIPMVAFRRGIRFGRVPKSSTAACSTPPMPRPSRRRTPPQPRPAGAGRQGAESRFWPRCRGDQEPGRAGGRPGELVAVGSATRPEKVKWLTRSGLKWSDRNHAERREPRRRSWSAALQGAG